MKIAAANAAGMNADEMIASIRTNNLARLTLIPGIGRKTAERLVMDELPYLPMHQATVWWPAWSCL